MSRKYDEHETIAGLRVVVADRGPAYVYERQAGVGFVCVYWDRVKGCPSCLVGHLLAQFGFPEPPPSIEGTALYGLVHGSEAGSQEFAAYFTERFTFAALRLLAAAQNEQDQGTTWGGALREAEREYAKMTGRGE